MRYMIKMAMASMIMGAVAITAGGCAKDRATKSQIQSYRVPDSKLVNSPSPKANTEYAMARLLRAQGKDEQAELVLVGITQEHPEFSPSYNDLAEIRLKGGKFDEAVAYLNQGLQIAPNDPVLQNNAGVCALLKHDYEKALTYFRHAEALAPHEQKYHANVALATGLTGNTEESKNLYQKIVPGKDAEFNAEIIKQMLAPQPELITPAD